MKLHVHSFVSSIINKASFNKSFLALLHASQNTMMVLGGEDEEEEEDDDEEEEEEVVGEEEEEEPLSVFARFASCFTAVPLLGCRVDKASRRRATSSGTASLLVMVVVEVVVSLDSDVG